MPHSPRSFPRLAFIGFGEAAQAFLAGWAPDDPAQVSAYDILSEDPGTRDLIQSRYAACGVSGHRTPAQALAGVGIVFSLVTPDQALAAATTGASALEPGTLWLDCNYCAPGTKRQAAQVIAAAGGCYVDVAVMAPVHPKRHLVPLLVSGPHAERAVEALRGLEMTPEIAGDKIGQASSVKMLRSVMIKGMEALTAECFLAARRAGIDKAVIASLEASDPDIDWRARGAYGLERMLVHGARRAAEMREVSRTVADLGLSGAMAAAASVWQDRVAACALASGPDELEARLDALLSRL
ncbi:DUF1932 domain-containing protein [Sulfitobacter sp. LCG007]